MENTLDITAVVILFDKLPLNIAWKYKWIGIGYTKIKQKHFIAHVKSFLEETLKYQTS